MASTESTSTVSSCCYEFKGLEKAFLQKRIRIAHAMKVTADTKEDLDRVVTAAPLAWQWVIARHPKMRAVMPPDSNGMVQIQPHVSDSVACSALHVMDLKTAQAQSYPWQKYVWEECHRELKASFSFSMTVLPQAEQTAILVLFSDHALSDGFSGYVVLRDFVHVATGTAPSDLQPKEQELYRQATPPSLALQPSTMDMLHQQTILRRLYNRSIAWVGRVVFKHVLASYQSILSHQLIPKDQKEKRSTFNFESGSSQRLNKALQRCRDAGMTLLGPMGVAIAVAVAAAAGKVEDNQDHFTLHLSIDYNVRSPAMGKNHVGCHIGIGELQKYTQGGGGIPLDANFWDAARTFKQETTACASGVAFDAVHAFAHYNSNSLADWAAETKDGTGGDVNISNLGRWPFDRRMGSVSIDSVHLYHKTLIGGLDVAIVFFITSVDRLHYAMSSSLADSAVADRIFQTAVRIIESLGDKDPDVTVREVLEQAQASCES